jgi:di/tricarboxylate transporter
VRFAARLRDVTLQAGDVIVLKGDLANFPDKLKELGLLPLAPRTIRLGNVRRALEPVAILVGAMILTAFGLVPVAVAFFTAVLMILVGALSLRDAHDAVDWPILVMLARDRS